MIKSRVFSFDENKLLEDIERYETTTGKRATELQCNLNTIWIWSDLYKDVLWFSEINDISNGILCKYRGIPVLINSRLDDGTIGIC